MVDERDQLAPSLEEQRRVATEAEAEYLPLRDVLIRAEGELAEAERMERERAEQLAKVGDVGLLLAALERLGK